MKLSEEYEQRGKANRESATRSLALAKYYAESGNADESRKQLEKYRHYTQLAEENEALARISREKEANDRESN